MRLFDTGTGKLLQQLGDVVPIVAQQPQQEGGHLSMRCSSLTWVTAAKKAAKGRRKSERADAAGAASLVVGTESGEVLSWNIAVGELQWRTANCHDGPVACLAYAPASGVLYTGGEGGVRELDTTTGEVKERWEPGSHAVTALACSQDGERLMVGGATLALWDAAERTRLRKCSGHANAVRTLAFEPGGRFALSAAPGDRYVAVWSCDMQGANGAITPSKGKGAKAAAALLALDDAAPLQLATAAADAGGAFVAAAVSELGVAYVWLCSAAGQSVAGRVIRVGPATSPSAAPLESLLVAAVSPASDAAATVLVARGSVARATFDRVAVPLHDAAADANGDAHVITLKPSRKGLLLGDDATPGKRKGKNAAGAEVVGPDNAADALLPRPAAANGSASGRKRAAAEEEDGGGAAARGGGAAGPSRMEGLEGAAAGELTLGERLRMLELASGLGGDEDGAGAARRGDDPFGGKVPSADSLAVLLSQALTARDNSMLERVLSVGDERVLANTVKRLKPEDAVAFLGVAITKLHVRPQRGTQLARWIRAILLGHASHLMSAPAARKLLSSLYSTLEARLALHRPMLALAGRLELLLAQQLSVQEGGLADGDEQLRGPLVEYNAVAAGDVGIEDARMERRSDDEEDGEGSEWETDEEGGKSEDEDGEGMSEDDAEEDDSEDDEDEDE